MSSAFYTAVLLTALGGEPVSVSTNEAAAAIRPCVKTGSLLFSQGDCLAVRVFSGSPYTHVGVVVVSDDGVRVFDSCPNHGVRVCSLNDYTVWLGESDVYICNPTESFNSAESKALTTALEKQLGRPYAVRHHVTGSQVEGLHCSEYVTGALVACHRVSSDNPARVSPGGLLEGVIETNIYRHDRGFSISEPPPPTDPNAGWCSRLWTGTKRRASAVGDKLAGWFLCK